MTSSRLCRRNRGVLCFLALFAWAASGASAHGLTVTHVDAAFVDPGKLSIVMEVDLSSVLPSAEAYYALSQTDRAHQTKEIQRLVPVIREALQLYIGRGRLELTFLGYTLPRLSKAEFADPAVDKFTLLRFGATLPATREALYLLVPPGAPVQHPIGLTVAIPAAHVSVNYWIEDESGETDGFDWAPVVPGGSRPPAPDVPGRGH